MIPIRIKKILKRRLEKEQTGLIGNKPVGRTYSIEEETNHALMAISSNNEVSLCSKTCIDSYNKLKTLCDEQMNQLANEIYAKDEKLKRYRRIGMKAVKEKEQLKKIVDSWKEIGEREAEFKKQRVFNTGNRVAKPVWTNANRVNHANKFVPRPVQLNAGRPNINSIRPNINTGRTNVNSVRPKVNTVSSNVNTVRSRQPVPTKTSNSFSLKRPQDHLKILEKQRWIYYLRKVAKATLLVKIKMNQDVAKLTNPLTSLKGIFDEDSYDEESSVQTRSRVKKHLMALHFKKCSKTSRNNHKDQQHCLFACFLSQEEPKKISEALKDDSWVEAMQEELLQFRLQQVWILVDLPHEAKVIGTKWVYRNKRDERGVVVRNKARLVAQDEEVYVSQPPGFVDPDHPKKVYKVVKALYGLHQALRTWDKKDIMLVQVYVDDIIFGSTKKSWCDEFEALRKQISDEFYGVKTAITPMETKVALTKDEEAVDVDVTPMTSHLNAVKRIFKYLKGKHNLGLWYPRESPFDLEAFSDSDYGGSNLDRKSITGGCQFLRQRLISWQCKKQTIVATSTTEAEYVAATNCCEQVLWVQNQLLGYGFNFMNTKIHIDNESTICIVKNQVYHSKTKHIEIRQHFIRDCYKKKLIKVEKIHTYLNVADLLTKSFDGPRFNFLVVSIGIAWICRCKEGVLRSLFFKSGSVNFNSGRLQLVLVAGKLTFAV
ncbi:putative ribonuclease H-like domain-containing protein [Tanacetum coccineum]|uniref:Ribonuclease H-like domain-containing protein n=1 Tax=Tanacetum coccineum TaxID=301880 RepID=A0ABQ4XH21_9ASTR